MRQRDDANPDAWSGTWLIQALNRPRHHDGPFKVNPFSFGGGGSGLNKEAAEILENIWSPAYMGAAEYEFGAFADALRKIVQFRTMNRLTTLVLPINGFTSEGDRWASRSRTKAKTAVYLICCDSHVPKVCEVVEALINNTKIDLPNGGHDHVKLKCGIRIWEALYDPSHYWRESNFNHFGGGLELDNGWFVFTDVEMFRNVCRFFDLEIPEAGIAQAPQYVPPKCKLDDVDVDRKILRAFAESMAVSHDFISLCAIVYDIKGEVGMVLPPEQMPLAQQVEKRIRSLIRGKHLVRDPKTKRLRKPCPSPS
jgi:hypothetical protein